MFVEEREVEEEGKGAEGRAGETVGGGGKGRGGKGRAEGREAGGERHDPGSRYREAALTTLDVIEMKHKNSCKF